MRANLNTQSVLVPGCLLLALLALPVMALAEPPPLAVNNQERLLVFAPHPDDEALGAGGLIQQVLAQNGSVRIVIATAGDGFVEAVQQALGATQPDFADYLSYGAARLIEAQRAAQTLGDGRIQLNLLGFPDAGLQPMLDSYWRPDQPERSVTTGVNAVPYAAADYPGRSYSGTDLHAALLHLLRETQPSLVVMPDTLDEHPDHAALGQFVLLALRDWLRAKNVFLKPRLLAYLVHWEAWPTGATTQTPQDLSDTPLYLPDDLPQRDQQRVCYHLSFSEQQTKRAALAQHQTQQQTMAPFLSAFVRATECMSLLTIEAAPER